MLIYQCCKPTVEVLPNRTNFENEPSLPGKFFKLPHYSGEILLPRELIGVHVKAPR